MFKLKINFYFYFLSKTFYLYFLYFLKVFILFGNLNLIIYMLIFFYYKIYIFNKEILIYILKSKEGENGIKFIRPFLRHFCLQEIFGEILGRPSCFLVSGVEKPEIQT